VPYSLLLLVVWGDIEVFPVLVVVAASFTSVPLRSSAPSSSPSLMMHFSSSLRVRQPLQHLRLVPADAQDQGVKWEAWGPVSHEGPWGPVQGQQQAP
jgi:hypothetical protein